MNILSGLQLTPFEWTMTSEFTSAPMDFVIRFNCVGTIDAEKFSQAILSAIRCQPLLQANAKVGQTHRTSYWRPASNTIPKITWLEGDPDQGKGLPDDYQPINLENEIGFRFYGWRNRIAAENRVIMKFVFHHACCDGKGSLDFIEQTLLRYQHLVTGDRVESQDRFEHFDSERIHNRNLPAANRLKFIDRIWRSVVVRPKRVANILFSSSRVISTGSNENDELFVDPPQQCSTTLSLETTRQLGIQSQLLGVSTNVILARDLFLALNDYLNEESLSNGSNPLKASSARLRILIPFSLRDERHGQMPAANCVSMAYLQANQKHLERDSRTEPLLLLDLEKQMNFIRRWQIQYSWIQSVEQFARLWPISKHFLKRESDGTRRRTSRPIATTLMTNLGRVFKNSHLSNRNGEIVVGPLTIKAIHSVAPCNSVLQVIFSINFYADRLTLDVTYLPATIKRDKAQNLLDSWTRRICDSAKFNTPMA